MVRVAGGRVPSADALREDCSMATVAMSSVAVDSSLTKEDNYSAGYTKGQLGAVSSEPIPVGKMVHMPIVTTTGQGGSSQKSAVLKATEKPCKQTHCPVESRALTVQMRTQVEVKTCQTAHSSCALLMRMMPRAAQVRQLTMLTNSSMGQCAEGDGQPMNGSQTMSGSQVRRCQGETKAELTIPTPDELCSAVVLLTASKTASALEVHPAQTGSSITSGLRALAANAETLEIMAKAMEGILSGGVQMTRRSGNSQQATQLPRRGLTAAHELARGVRLRTQQLQKSPGGSPNTSRGCDDAGLGGLDAQTVSLSNQLPRAGSWHQPAVQLIGHRQPACLVSDNCSNKRRGARTAQDFGRGV